MSYTFTLTPSKWKRDEFYHRECTNASNRLSDTTPAIIYNTPDQNKHITIDANAKRTRKSGGSPTNLEIHKLGKTQNSVSFTTILINIMNYSI